MLSIGHSNYWASENDHMTISVFLGFLKKYFLLNLTFYFKFLPHSFLHISPYPSTFEVNETHFAFLVEE